MSDDNERFYKKSFFMPFGIYNTDKLASGRAAEVLIGRNNERASFIRRLLNSGKGGAYLITGQRGTGKTSFVDYCMRAYEQDNVQRLSNTNLTKNFRDKFASFFFIITLILFPGFLSTLLHYSSANTLFNIIVGLPLILFIFALAYFSYIPLKTGLSIYNVQIGINKGTKSIRELENLEYSEVLVTRKISYQFVWVVLLIFSFTSVCMIGVVLSLVAGLIPIAFILYIKDKKFVTSRIAYLSIFKTITCQIYLSSLLALVSGPILSVFFANLASPLFINIRPELIIIKMFSIFIMITIVFIFIVYYEEKLIIRPAQLINKNRKLITGEASHLPRCFSQCSSAKAIDDNNPEETWLKLKAAYQNYYKILLKNSWLNTYISVWQPIIKIKINLGFDNIEHSNVIYGLLKQMQRQYVDCFLKLNNVRVLSTRAFIAIVIFVLSIQIGDSLFAFKKPASITQAPGTTTVNKPLVEYIFGFELKHHMAIVDDYGEDIPCTPRQDEVVEESAEKLYIQYTGPVKTINSSLFYGLFFEMINIKIENPSDDQGSLKNSHFYYVLALLLNETIFPFQKLRDQPLMLADSIPIPSYSIRAYHFYIFLLIVLVYTMASRFFPILPYHYNNRQLKQVINRLTATQTESNAVSFGKFNVQLPFARQQVFKPLGSRDIEQHFLEMITSLTANNKSLLGHLISIPTPDVTIIFDELDKLGGTRNSNKSDNEPEFVDPSDDFGSRRSDKIKALLSDLKNVIDSKHCRFILIGGRHLRDEWLADQTKRDQLLPSIFDQAIYLPSLLTDNLNYNPQVTDNMLLGRIKEYICQQHQRANHIFYRYKKEHVYLLSKGNKVQLKQSFAEQSLLDSRVELLFNTTNENATIDNKLYQFEANQTESNQIKNIELLSSTLLTHFAKYLAYRSHGIPKKMNELMGTFIKPPSTIAQLSAEPDHDNMIENCKDVLLFTNIDLCRIQLTSRFYDRIEHLLGRKLYARDDKLVTAVLFISDYLLKFHRRAFDWESLGKIDDIADIHHAPDLYKMTHEVVETFAEMQLHPILNGMYAFRFKSSTTREIAYLSKISPHESAAFNFTLDESKALKALYRKKLASPDGATAELSVSLGELYEYDQEYDDARNEYQKAIVLIDEKMAYLFLFNSQMADDPRHKYTNGHTNNQYCNGCYDYISILEYIAEDQQDNEMATSLATDWIVSRLRLMLKIGMTFEHTRNHERAMAYYHEANMLSRRFLNLAFNTNNAISQHNHNGTITSIYGHQPQTTLGTSNTNLYAKSFNILYQAGFAKAWLAEKQGMGTDVSLTIIQSELTYFENLLSDCKLKENVTEYVGNVIKQGLSNASFCLIKSELYNKAGNLCFFKGANIPEPHKANQTDINKNGYLYQATQYYATCLHYLRFYNLYRVEYSKQVLSPENDKRATCSPEQLPLYPLLESASTLAHFAESLLARVDMKDLLKHLEIKPPQSEPKKVLFDFMITARVCFNKWLMYKDKSEAEDNYWFFAKEAKQQLGKSDTSNVTMTLSLGCGDRSPIDVEDFIDMWFGSINLEYKPGDVSNQIINSQGTTGCSIERVLCYIALVKLSSMYLIKAGRIEEAAHELRRAITSIYSILELILLVKNQSTQGSIDFGINVNFKWEHINLTVFITILIEQAVGFAEKAIRLQSSRNLQKGTHDQKQTVDVVSSKLSLVSINLCIIAIKLSIAWQNDGFTYCLRLGYQGNITGDEECKHITSLSQLILELAKKHLKSENNDIKHINSTGGLFTFEYNKDLPEEPNKNIELWLTALQKIIENLCLIQRYPILNRLDMLQQLTLLLTRPENNDNDNIKMATNYTEELLEIVEQFDSPHHFTPIQVAFTCFHLADALEKRDEQSKAKYFYLRANEYFYKSQQMYTMRYEYDKSIGDLYYLYDDFNDRYIHHSKALQIMSSTISITVEREIHQKIKCLNQALYKNP